MLNILIGLVVALSGGFLYMFRKSSSANALLQNLDVKNKTLSNDKSIASDQGQLESEAIKRDGISKAAQDAKSKQDDIQSLIDYFNKK